jgi:hypothetical protein
MSQSLTVFKADNGTSQTEALPLKTSLLPLDAGDNVRLSTTGKTFSESAIVVLAFLH